jgi:pimeloyl-ACP methyl ester carboxylesterase
MYKEKRLSRSEFVPIRGLNYHVRIWETPTESLSMPPPLVLLHGWMDVAASYQFMVDAFSSPFAEGRTIIAPDWRGFGETAAPHPGSKADNYWSPDYLADLDFLLDHYVGAQAIDLVGHSMGGNVAMIYGGVRPARIRKLVNLEGFGLAATEPAQAPGRYAKWMNELKRLHRGELDLLPYDAVGGVARRLMKTNPRLSPDKANWLASHWSSPDAAGKWRILGDPAHKIINANIYRAEETLAIYRCITAPVLAVEASDDSLAKWHQGAYTMADYHERLKEVPRATVAVIEDAGHMLHHDQPEALAQQLEAFLDGA